MGILIEATVLLILLTIAVAIWASLCKPKRIIQDNIIAKGDIVGGDKNG